MIWFCFRELRNDIKANRTRKVPVIQVPIAAKKDVHIVNLNTKIASHMLTYSVVDAIQAKRTLWTAQNVKKVSNAKTGICNLLVNGLRNIIGKMSLHLVLQHLSSSASLAC